MKKGAKAMGLGNIARDGRPPLLRPGKQKTKNSLKTDFGKGIYQGLTLVPKYRIIQV